MPSLCRVMEIALYSLLNFVPYIVLALYPFRNSLRFTMRTTVILVALASFLQIGLGIWAAFFDLVNTSVVSMLSTAVYFAFYFLAVRVHPGKTLFTLLMLSNIANLIVICSKCIEGRIFPALAIERYRWSFSAVMLAVELLILVPLFFYIKGIYSDAMAKESSRFIWCYLWLIPATFYLIWFYYLYSNNSQSSLEIALQPKNAFFLLFVELGAFLIYYIVTKLLNEFDRNIRLEKQNHMLLLANLQYENLKEKIAETRHARHDLRHHVAVMTGYLSNGELEKLREYLIGYGRSMPEDSSDIFCNNYAVNLLLTYFAQQAKENGIDFAVHADIPSESGISESDLSALIGNLLENALDACCAQKRGDKRIVFRGRSENGSLLITVDNTYDGEIRQDRDGAFLSAKHNKPAVGLESVSHIAARCGGVFRANWHDGIFYASVRLETQKSGAGQR